jgi:hypothetical protein
MSHRDSRWVDPTTICPQRLSRTPRTSFEFLARGDKAVHQPLKIRRSSVALVGIKGIHTLAWFSIESCMIYLLYAGLRKRSDRRAAIAAAVVGAESLIFAANGFRCPLTKLAEQVGAERGSVTDIFLPRWFAHNLPAIHVPLLVLATFLHVKNLRRRGSAKLL